MKLSVGFATALAGVATALSSVQPADVYLLRSKQASSSDTPSLPRQIARLIFLQRLSPEGQHATWDLPESISNEKAVDYLNEFGMAPQGLFSNAASTDPSQLVVMVEGITADDAKTLQKSLGVAAPSFRVGDAPSSAGNDLLLANDFQNVGVTSKNCQLEKAINPFAEECWTGKSAVARFDAKKDSSIVASLTENISRLRSLATNGEMETTLIIMPESSRKSQIRSWSSKPEEIRRRQVEEVMTNSDEHDQPAATSPVQSKIPFPSHFPRGSIPSCFTSKDACEKATGNCSSRGECKNKYEKSDGSSRGTCFACQCLATDSDGTTNSTKGGSRTHWGGPACSKVDVSVPFWLFAGFTIAMIGALTFAIGLLFSVGEEPLPGVIGAGVSRSK